MERPEKPCASRQMKLDRTVGADLSCPSPIYRPFFGCYHACGPCREVLCTRQLTPIGITQFEPALSILNSVRGKIFNLPPGGNTFRPWIGATLHNTCSWIKKYAIGMPHCT